MCTFDAAQQKIKIKEKKNLLAKKKSKCLFLSLKNEPFRVF
jgi:hypothetical protein